jgi:uncharacterized surface protein with fasciclin (FAS1) repeats
VTSTRRARGALLTAAAAVTLALPACSSDDAPDAAAPDGSAAAPPTAAVTGTTTALPADQPFGTGCSALPATGPGSLAGMSTAPVATAASSNPVLVNLTQAITMANLVDSLNSQQDVTVLAPANQAWQAVPAAQLDALVADVPQLTAVVTHHVLQGRLAPAQLAGEQTTLDNDTVTVEGAGGTFTISGDQTLTGKPATVLCGNVPTANATVYIIDQVLKPKAAG